MSEQNRSGSGADPANPGKNDLQSGVLDALLSTESDVETYEEWRVTGQPNSVYGVDYPPYNFTWTNRRPDHPDPEAQARAFIAGMNRHADGVGVWTDGPHLHHHIVIVTPWEPADP